MLDLFNLRSFIKTVDKVETNIDNEVRLNYRQKYIAKIKQLMDLLDEERIELVQRRKTIEEEIQSILDSDDPFKTWYKIFEAYMYSIRNLDSKREELNAFLIAASDAGITYAHDRAADLFIVKGDYPEAVRRLRLLFEKHGKDKVPKDIAHTITNALYCITLRSNYSSEDIDEMIKCFKAQGYPIELTDEGVYYWDSKKKR